MAYRGPRDPEHAGKVGDYENQHKARGAEYISQRRDYLTLGCLPAGVAAHTSGGHRGPRAGVHEYGRAGENNPHDRERLIAGNGGKGRA